MKIYFVRHQAAGFVTKYPFLQAPSDEQIAAVTKECFQSFGYGHPKTPEVPYWTTVVEFEALDKDTVPKVEERDLSTVTANNKADAPHVTVSGTGSVT